MSGYLTARRADGDGLVFAGVPGGIAALRAGDGTRARGYRTSPEKSDLGFPAAAHGAVYVGTETGLAALRAADGTRLWQYGRSRPAPGSWPAAAGGRVFFVDFNADLFALGAASGRRSWNFLMGLATYSSPVAAGPAVYAGSLEASYGLRAADGARMWQFPVTSTGPAIGPDGTIYLASSVLPFTVYALRP